MTDLSTEIRSRGYFEIVIRPEAFVKERLAYEDLWTTIQRCALSLRGWDFPHLGGQETVERLEDSIRQSEDWQYYREVWRFFQSGQFAYLGGITEDWAERSERWQPSPVPAGASGLLGTQDVVARFTETYELAARLANTLAGDDQMRISLALRGLAGRQLYAEDPARHLSQVFKAAVTEYVVEETVERGALLADSRGLARIAVRKLLLRFGFDIHETVVSDLQGKLRA
jgi:hypothetical protein